MKILFNGLSLGSKFDVFGAIPTLNEEALPPVRKLVKGAAVLQAHSQYNSCTEVPSIFSSSAMKQETHKPGSSLKKGEAGNNTNKPSYPDSLFLRNSNAFKQC